MHHLYTGQHRYRAHKGCQYLLRVLSQNRYNPQNTSYKSNAEAAARFEEIEAKLKEIFAEAAIVEYAA